MANGDDVYARATIEVDTSQATEGVRAFNRELEKMRDAAASAGGAPRATVAVAAGAAPALADPYAGRSTAYMAIREFFAGIKQGLRGEEIAAAAPQRAAAAPAGVTTPGLATAQQQQAYNQQVAQVASTNVVKEFFGGIQSAFTAKGTTIKEQFTNFAKSIASAAESGLAALGRAVTQAAMVTAIVGPLIAFAGALKLLKTSFDWAKEAAADQLKVAGRTRRFYPQLVGEGVEAAEEEMRTRMGVATALFGSAADSMQESISRKTTEFRLGRGLRGERDIFARWGITPEGLRNLQLTTGKRPDLTSWLNAFVLKREELERLLGQAKSPEEKLGLQRRMAQLMDDAARIGDQRFADMVGIISSRDIPRITKGIEKAAPLGHVENYTRRSVDFTVALGSLQETFKALKTGISGDVQPAITSFLVSLNRKLTDTTESGTSLGMMFRQLASALATKAWEALQVVMDKLTPERVTGWIEIVTSWSAKESADKIVTLFKAIMSIGKAVWSVIKAIGEFMGVLPEEVGGKVKKEGEKEPRVPKPGVVKPAISGSVLSPDYGGGVTPGTGGAAAAAGGTGALTAPATAAAVGAAPSATSAVASALTTTAAGGAPTAPAGAPGTPTEAVAAGPAPALGPGPAVGAGPSAKGPIDKGGPGIAAPPTPPARPGQAAPAPTRAAEPTAAAAPYQQLGLKPGQIPTPQGLVVHHTAGSTVQGAISAVKQQGYGVQMITDRQGNTIQMAPEGQLLQPTRAEQAKPGKMQEGVQVVALDESDVTSTQKSAVARLAQQRAGKYGWDVGAGLREEDIQGAGKRYGPGEISQLSKDVAFGVRTATWPTEAKARGALTGGQYPHWGATGQAPEGSTLFSGFGQPATSATLGGFTVPKPLDLWAQQEAIARKMPWAQPPLREGEGILTGGWQGPGKTGEILTFGSQPWQGPWSGMTTRDGAAWGNAAGESLAGVIDGLSVTRTHYAPTSYGVKTVPKPTGGDVPTEA